MTNENKKLKLETEIELCKWFMKCFDISDDVFMGVEILSNINRCKKEITDLSRTENEKMARHIARYFGIGWDDVLKVIELKEK
jgi:hypothetical protein